MAVDFEKLADGGMPAGQLAEAFLSDYAGGVELAYPLNPFQMLRDMGVAFSFRPFRSYEGVYIPSEGPGDTPVVGINLRRPISRQRFTAAHELCHHLKDSHRTITCEIGSDSPIERYAESFAAHLLMPAEELSRQVRLRGTSGKVSLDDVLLIAHHFGVSFQACLYRLAYDLHALEGDVSPRALDIRRSEFKPDFRRETLGLTDLHLYEQLFDAADDYLELPLTPRTRQLFETEYVFHDSRMEGVEISQEKASEIVVDLRLHGNRSDYCRSENRNVIEVAGLSRAYDYVFDKTAGARLNDGTQADVSIYDARAINGGALLNCPSSRIRRTVPRVKHPGYWDEIRDGRQPENSGGDVSARRGRPVRLRCSR